MIKNLLLLSLLFAISLTTQAQQTHQHNERCGHSIVMKTMENKFPGYSNLVNATFQKAKEKAAAPSASKRTADVYTIQVVVHVVWKEAEENIEDQIIHDQIAALNEDFRALNADFENLRPEFGDLVDDTYIQFELAEIIRVETVNTFGIDFIGGFSDNLLKDSANGGSSPWDTEKFLNIWVCNITPLAIGPLPLGQVLGYSFPPINIADYPEINNWPTEQLAAFQDPAYDGVVIHYPAFGGRNNMYNDPDLGGDITFEGRTTVHEIGHYLGLRHVWGDAIEFLGEDGCAVDDGIDDTPNAANNSQASGCDVAKNTCGSGTDDLPDMWENYMDYSVEACQVAFTTGQIDLIRAVLEGPRSTLLTNTGTKSVDGLAEKVTVFPNPTTSLLNVQVEGLSGFNITIRDVVGRVIVTTKNQNQITTLDLSAQSNGIYFVEINNGASSTTKKVVLVK